MIRYLTGSLVLLSMFVPAVATAAAPKDVAKPAVVLNSAQRIGNRVATVPEPPAPVQSTPTIDPRRAVLDQVNALRTAHGLAPLRLSQTLNDVAQAHTLNQAADGRIYHIDPDDGSDGGVRITRAGYVWGAWGENLASGGQLVGDAVASWMDSPSHCRNILNPGFTEMGVGYVDGGPYWTQNFARPLTAPRPSGTYNPAWC
jgi:uncharacterized protein YkwD